MRVSRVTPHAADLGASKNLLFVKVETDDGLHGWGECYTQADRDRPVAAHVEELARGLVGRDATRITHFVHAAYHDFAAKRGAMDFWCAVSGLEQALWDLAGKRHGVPVHVLLGGRCRDRVRVYANRRAPGTSSRAGSPRSSSTRFPGLGARTCRAQPSSRPSPPSPPCARRSARTSTS
jgi:galactonate dehydratase